jgi:hemolysin activation/secretion protein
MKQLSPALSVKSFMKLGVGVFTVTMGMLGGGAALARETAPPPDTTGRTATDTTLPDTSASTAVEFEITPCPFETRNEPVSFRDLRLEGSTVLSDRQVSAVFAGVLASARRESADGRETLKVLCVARDKLLEAYGRAGVPLARIELEPQTISDGIVRMRAFEPELVGVALPDFSDPRRAPFAAVVTALKNELLARTQNIALPWAELERFVLLMRETPGLSTLISVRPSAKELTDSPRSPLEAVVEVSDVDRTRAYYGIQHLGPEVFGRWAGVVGGSIASVAPWGGDELRAALYSTLPIDNSPEGKQRLLQINYDWRAASGLKLTSGVTYARSEPGGPLADLNLRGDSFSARLGASYPFVLSSAFRLTGDVGVEMLEQDNFVFADQSISSDSLRVVAAGVSARWRDVDLRRAFASASLQVRQGLTGYGASDPDDTDLSRVGATIDFLKVQAEIELEARMARGLPGVNLRVTGQWTEDSLPGSEEYLVGNFGAGRGYDPGSITGDRGYGAQLELLGGQWTGGFGPDSRWEPYAFVDYADTYQLGDAVLEPRTYVTSYGAGARFAITEKVSLDVSYAKALDAPGLGQPKPTPLLLVNFTQRF